MQPPRPPSSYAPELAVKGTVAGAVPADLGAVGKNLDGGLFAAFGLFAMVGLSAGHHIDLDPYLNARGQETMRGVENACVLDLFDYSGLKSSTLTTDGRALTDLLDEEPFATVLAENRIGQRRPAALVLLTHSVLDDTIPSTGEALPWLGARFAGVPQRSGCWAVR